MTGRDFCYWLQGYFELDRYNRMNASGQVVATDLSVDQTECIKKHLSMVFKHEIDPSMGDAKMLKALSDIHNDPFSPKVNC